MAIKRREYYYNPLDVEKDIAIGIKLNFGSTNSILHTTQVAASSSIAPVEKKTYSLFELSYSTEEQVRSNLFLLLLTKKGERLMHPTFGVSLLNYVFEQKTHGFEQNLKDSLKSEINYWLPYIVVENLDVIAGDNEHSISINLTFKITANGSEQTITIFVNETGVNIEGT